MSEYPPSDPRSELLGVDDFDAVVTPPDPRSEILGLDAFDEGAGAPAPDPRSEILGIEYFDAEAAGTPAPAAPEEPHMPVVDEFLPDQGGDY